MPIIINEIVFKGTIASEGEKERRAAREPLEIDQKALVEVVVEEVMKALERERER